MLHNMDGRPNLLVAVFKDDPQMWCVLWNSDVTCLCVSRKLELFICTMQASHSWRQKAMINLLGHGGVRLLGLLLQMPGLGGLGVRV